ncbi:MAG: hypothetical protein Q8K50_19745 [Hydrogenophaga sp.]|nr:hypothetical protein [Hydrogenophaga sp.]
MTPLANSLASGSHEESKVLPLAPAGTASAVPLPSTHDSTPSSILDSSIQKDGDGKDFKAPPPVLKTAGILTPHSVDPSVPPLPSAESLSGSITKEVEASPHTLNGPKMDPLAVQQALNLTLFPEAALTSDETRADTASPKHASTQSKPPETARQIQSPFGATSQSSHRTKKSWWIGVAAFVSVTICGVLLYGIYQWSNAVAEKEALLASHRQEIEVRQAAEQGQRQHAEAELAAAQKRTAEAEFASISKPMIIVPSHSNQSLFNLSSVRSQELFPLTAKFDISAGFPLLKEMVFGSVSGDTDRIERSAVQLQALLRPSAGDRRTARALNNEALSALNAGNPHAAVELFQRASLADASDPEILGNLAWSYLKVGKPSVAFDAAVISLIHTPRRASSWGTLGISLIQQNEAYMDLAVASLQNAYRYAGNPEKSREFFQQIAEQDESPEVRRLGQKVLPTLEGITPIGLESERMKGR